MGLFNYAPRCNSRVTVGPRGVTVKVAPQYTFNDGYVMEVKWDRCETWTIPAKNDYCLKNLAKSMLTNGTFLNAVKVEVFDPDTHQLLATAQR